MRFGKLLVANRGEIARRVLRAARARGLRTVAVYSDADAGAPFVREADEAVRIGPAPAAESYLDPSRILGAAWRTGADAVHPGYGFLAENAAFAEACASAGLVFVGPPPSAIEAMGSKVRARRLMAEAGVPVVPGFDGSADAEALLEAAKGIGLPLLVKASAGGGGKGMRLVRAEADLEEAIASCQREAAKAFSDGTVFLERYIDRPRHVEVQVLADEHGSVLHLFERECSVQRRHQKIVEEAPSPAVDEALREGLTSAAVAAARAIGYRNAGTVEFILAPDGAFYFLEMNTRLQVEHPVTEMVTGKDLVDLQLGIAQGEPIGLAQEDVRLEGHAVEVRLYAEDPEKGYLPQTGRLLAYEEPEVPGVRYDSGVEAGSEVTVHYDPMLAKVIAWGRDRAEASRRLGQALSRLVCGGVTTNRALLERILAHEAFLAGEIDTHYLERHPELAAGDRADGELPAAVRHAALAAAVHDALLATRARAVLPELAPGWRSSRFRDARARYTWRERELAVGYRFTADREATLTLEDGEHACIVGSCEPGALRLTTDHVTRTFRLAPAAKDGVLVLSPLGQVELGHVEELPLPGAGHDHAPGAIEASMPGSVLKVLVSEGEEVTRGQPVVILESMKMEAPIAAGHVGTVIRIHVAVGQQVDAGMLLVEVEPAAP